MSSSFPILSSDKNSSRSTDKATDPLREGIHQEIETLVHSAPIFLFMKGTPEAPRCGFSANVVGILNAMKVNFKTFDILTDEGIRQGVKEYSGWPTYPQLYVEGELIGGNDIVTEMFESSELKEILPKT